jgi:hypothetical protein
MAISFARSSTPDTVRASVRCGRGLQAAAPASGCCAVTCRSRTPQTARKASARMGCDKNVRSLCCAPWHRRMTKVRTRRAKRRCNKCCLRLLPQSGATRLSVAAATCVARLAIILSLSATRFMADLIRGSLTFHLDDTFTTAFDGGLRQFRQRFLSTANHTQ